MKSKNNDKEPQVHKIKKTQSAITKGGSVLSRYQDVIVGNRSWSYTLYYEFSMWLTHIPGALGLVLRKIFWPRLFATCGKGVMFAEGIILRHPRKIHLGNRVILSERCTLDARTNESDKVIVIEDDVILSNDVAVSCKEGSVKIGRRTGVGTQTVIHSRIHCPIDIGEDGLIGPRCYIAGGGSYKIDRLDIPISQQGKIMDGGVKFENDVWLGANVTVLGGVTLGTGCVAAAGAVITKSMPPRAICMGVPAKVMKMRGNLAKRSESITN